MSKLLTKIFSESLKRLGYEYNINPGRFYSEHPNKKFKYGLIKTTASYSPWLEDTEFQKVYQVIRPYTMVEYYRIYELWAMMDEVCKLPGKGALLEVGVWRGGTTGIMARRLEMLGSTEIFYAADTFSGVVKSSDLDSHYNDGEHADTDIAQVQKLLFQDLALKNVKILKGIFPDETQDQIPAGTQFRFCHVDVDVYKSAEGILDWIWDRMLIGGIVVFDDYGAITCDGITEYVNRHKNKDDRTFIYNANGHAIFIKLK